MQTELFDIAKRYNDNPSKDKPKYESDLDELQALDSLDGIENTWRKTGIVISRQDRLLIVCESDGSNEVSFEIIPQQID